MNIDELKAQSSSSSSNPSKRGQDHLEDEISGFSKKPALGSESTSPLQLSAGSMKRVFRELERSINENQEQRNKFSAQPQKFMESEATLHENLEKLVAFMSKPSNLNTILQIDGLPSLLSLLTHPNPDIISDVLDLLIESTEEDIVPEDKDGYEKYSVQFVDAILECDILELLGNLKFGSSYANGVSENRSAEEIADRKRDQYRVLEILENCLNINPKKFSEYLLRNEVIVEQIFQLTEYAGDPSDFNETIQYGSEVLAIALQVADSKNFIHFLKNKRINTMEFILKSLSIFRNRDPDGAEEQEFLENLFDCLCCLLNGNSIAKRRFLEEEGVELMVIMLRKKLFSRMRALKVISYCTSGLGAEDEDENRLCCEKLIDLSGFKYIMGAFLKKSSKKLKKAYPKAFSDIEEDEHSLTIITGIFRNLSDEAPNFRLSQVLAKFTGAKFEEQIERLIELHKRSKSHLFNTDEKIKDEKNSLIQRGYGDSELQDMEVEWYLSRLNNGLFTLQLVDLIIMDLIYGKGKQLMNDDDQWRKFALEFIYRIQDAEDISLGEIAGIVKEYSENLGDSSETSKTKDRASHVAALREQYRCQVMIENFTVDRDCYANNAKA